MKERITIRLDKELSSQLNKFQNTLKRLNLSGFIRECIRKNLAEFTSIDNSVNVGILEKGQ